MSEHRREKEKSRQDKQGKLAKHADGEKDCSNCGNRNHGSSLQERRDFPCPAFNIKCRDCGKIGHFAWHCSATKGKTQSQNKSGRARS